MSEIGGVMPDMSVPDSIALAKKRLEINRSVLLKASLDARAAMLPGFRQPFINY